MLSLLLLSRYWLKNTDYLTQIPLRPLQTLFQLRRRTESHRPWRICSPFSRTLLHIIIVLLGVCNSSQTFSYLRSNYHRDICSLSKPREEHLLWSPRPLPKVHTENQVQTAEPSRNTITPFPGSFNPARMLPTLSTGHLLGKDKENPAPELRKSISFTDLCLHSAKGNFNSVGLNLTCTP